MIFAKYMHRLSDADRPLFEDFVKEYYHDRYILLNRKFVDWQYGTPYSSESGFIVLATNNKIEGFLGAISLKMNYFGKVTDCVYLANLMASMRLRNKGVGIDFITKACESVGIAYTVGHNQIAGNLYDKLGWTANVKLHRWLLILDENKASDLAQKRVLSAASVEWQSFKDFKFERIDRFDKTADSFWKTIKNKYPISLERTSVYLNWRYAGHPMIKYIMFVAKKRGELISLLVLRIEEPPGFKIARIIDFISKDEAEIFTLQNAINFCRENGCHLIDFFFLGNFHIDSLEKVGFKEANQEPYFSIPLLFNPIDRERKYINFAFKIINPKIKNEKAADINNWYVTKGDGDQDRPNIL